MSVDRAEVGDASTSLRPISRREYAFWVLAQLAPRSSVSNLAVAFRTEATLRWWPLHAAVNHLLARHPALRIRFPHVDGVPLRQVVDVADAEVQIEVRTATEADLVAQVHEVTRRPFDLADELLFRVTLFQLPGSGSAVVFVVHHIICDAASLAVLITEAAAAYDGIAEDDQVPAALREIVPALPDREPPDEDLRYWVEQLRGHDSAGLALPWAGSSPVRPTFAGHTVMIPVPEQVAAAVQGLRKELRSTENLVLLSAFYLTLYRHGTDEDLVIGVPVSTRREEADAGVGFGVSTLPMRLRIDRRGGFRDLARSVRDMFLSNMAHSRVSVEAVLAELGHHSADWRTPIFRHLYNYRPWDETDARIAGERPEFLELLRDESRLDIDLTVIGAADPPLMIVNFSVEVHRESEIRALLDRMGALLEAAADEPDRPVGTLALATAAERVVLDRANDTSAEVGGGVLERFIAATSASPSAPALTENGVAVTYGELLAECTLVAGAMRAAGLHRGDVVGLAMGRGVRMAASMLGAWMLGAAYAPLDPAQPARRLRHQVIDADIALVVLADDAAPWADDRPVLRWAELTGAAPVEIPASAADPDRAAYVMHTSGSTGTPKGVVVTHVNLANVVGDFAARLGERACATTLWSTAVTFDISALELFLPLTTGGHVVVAAPLTDVGAEALLAQVERHDCRTVQGTPTFWRAVVPAAAGRLRGRTVLCGGEPLTADLAVELLGCGCRLLNVYGPTETTIWSTAAEITAETTATGDAVPIGVPIANTTAFVLDRHGEELPPGLVGELCIAGAGVSAGYLGLPQLTGERFGTRSRRGRFYRTGDLARWRPDGMLECLGRIDRQVKLRGHRIELAEVEAVLRGHPEVADAAVVVAGEPQVDGELRAFVLLSARGGPAGLPDRLWEHLRLQLPSYSLPSRISVVERFPTTANGKVDHFALLEIEPVGERGRSRDATVAPDPDPATTTQLTALWREVLGRPELDEWDNFFLNGGHSLLATQLATRLATSYGIDVPIGVVFDHPTARALSGMLTRMRGARAAR